MHWMERTPGLFLVVILVVGLVGCGQGSEDSAPAAVQEPAPIDELRETETEEPEAQPEEGAPASERMEEEAAEEAPIDELRNTEEEEEEEGDDAQSSDG